MTSIKTDMHATFAARNITWGTTRALDPFTTAVAFLEGAKTMEGCGGRIASAMNSTCAAKASVTQRIDLLCPIGFKLPAELKAGKALFYDENDTHEWYRITVNHLLARDFDFVNQPLVITACEDGSYDYFVEENGPGNYCRDHWAATLRGFGLYEIADKIRSIPYSAPARGR